MKKEFHLDEEVLFDTEEGSSQCHTHIVGRKPNQYIILDLIPGHPITSKLKVQVQVLVTCLRYPLCRFKTRIQSIIPQPPLLVLDYPAPQDIVLDERRRGERKKVFLPVTCYLSRIHTETPLLEGYILIISVSGCLILGDLKEFLGREIFLSFRIPWTGEEIRTLAQAIRCERTDKGIQSALEFIDLEPEEEMKLDSLVRFIKGE